MRIAYFDCFRGAGGDMIVASLIHAAQRLTGDSEPNFIDVLRQRLNALGLTGYTLSIQPAIRHGFVSVCFQVNLDRDHPQPCRHLKDILSILDKAKLSQRVRTDAGQIFQRLAHAEADVHGTGIDKVHFHEVGAVDAILDIVAAVTALEMLGIEKILCSPIPTGSGEVRCDHGLLPIPAPATAELLKGVPLAACEEPGELTTPTAAAVLTSLAAGFGPLPEMTVKAIGYGAGGREGVTGPNLLRVFVGETTPAGADGGDNDDGGEVDEIIVLETNLDDTTPEIIAHCTERLLQQGALDVYTMPIQMKKARSGVLLTVLCELHRSSQMEALLFAETTTFGIRRHSTKRVKLLRRTENVETQFGLIAIKVGRRNDIITATPEYESCKEAAVKHNVPLRTVMTAATLARETQTAGLK